MYRTLYYVNIYGSYKLSKNSPVFFGPPCISILDVTVTCVVCSYLLVLRQYEAVSFCDAVFANYVLLPLQQTHSVLLRKALWGEHLNVLHSLSLSVNQVTTTTTTTLCLKKTPPTFLAVT